MKDFFKLLDNICDENDIIPSYRLVVLNVCIMGHYTPINFKSVSEKLLNISKSIKDILTVYTRFRDIEDLYTYYHAKENNYSYIVTFSDYCEVGYYSDYETAVFCHLSEKSILTKVLLT